MKRSKTNNIRRPKFRNESQKTNLFAQGIYLWNEAQLNSKKAKTNEKARRLTDCIAKTCPIK